MATFHPNPNEEFEPWVEKAALDGHPFRIWHVVMFCLAGFVSAVILVCCCVKLRIPRTKQEIEANYRRKKLVSKFKARVKLIKLQDMDVVDLQKAIEIIQEDYKSESRRIELSTTNCNTAGDLTNTQRNGKTRFKGLLGILRMGNSNLPMVQPGA